MSTYMALVVEITTGDDHVIDSLRPGHQATLLLGHDQVDVRILSHRYVPEEEAPDVQ